MKRKTLLIIIAIFLFIELTLGILSQITHGDAWSVVSYTTVVLAFLMNLFFFKKTPSFIFTFLALTFTLIADFFLVIYDNFYVYAISAFIITHIFYFLRIYFETQKHNLKNIHIIIRIISNILGLIITYIILKDNIDLVSTLSVICYINLILNVIFCFINTKFNKQNLIFSLGLLFFALCDLFVGLYNISSYIDVSKGSLIDILTSTTLFLPWVFYTPSQALLAISLYPEYFKKVDSR